MSDEKTPEPLPIIEKQEPPPLSEQRYFGRLISKDPRDRRYAIERIETSRLYRYWYLPTVLDQGPTPRCVAFSSSGWLLAGPVRNVDPLTDRQRVEAFAQALYDECQRNDEWPGEDYAGTSVRAAFKVLRSRGFVREYNWAWDAETAARHILEVGPVVVGTEWLSGMDEPDADNYLHAEGGFLGGHAWLLIGFSRLKRNPDGTRGAFRMQNSWGVFWGQKGRAWISFADIQKLIANDGEVATAVEIDLDRVKSLIVA